MGKPEPRAATRALMTSVAEAEIADLTNQVIGWAFRDRQCKLFGASTMAHRNGLRTQPMASRTPSIVSGG